LVTLLILCRAALNATGDFAPGAKYGSLTLREALVKAWIRFYGPLYYYHESEAALNSAIEAEAAETPDEDRLDAAEGAYRKFRG
jgi:hypothetical protein